MKVRVLFKDETAWLTQKSLAELFGVGVPAVNKHLKRIFESGELVDDSVVSILETTAADGKTYKTRFYNLDAIIALGYRVNSYQATQFRIWATKTLREFIIKGFVLDDERLKQGKTLFGEDYFDELLERIREIRASERQRDPVDAPPPLDGCRVLEAALAALEEAPRRREEVLRVAPALVPRKESAEHDAARRDAKVGAEEHARVLGSSVRLRATAGVAESL